MQGFLRDFFEPACTRKVSCFKWDLADDVACAKRLEVCTDSQTAKVALMSLCPLKDNNDHTPH
jgi:hypothetical protein